MARSLPPALATETARLLAEWADLWNVPDLGVGLVVEISPRLRRSVGRCLPERQLIRLAPRVAEGSAATFERVLCHEAAHVAVYLRHGRAARAHGPQWRALVEAAGFLPEVSFTAPGKAESGARRRHDRLEWSHRCPVCHAERLAARPIRRWRCRACVEAGLDGRLEVTRTPSPAPPAP